MTGIRAQQDGHSRVSSQQRSVLDELAQNSGALVGDNFYRRTVKLSRATASSRAPLSDCNSGRRLQLGGELGSNRELEVAGGGAEDMRGAGSRRHVR